MEGKDGADVAPGTIDGRYEVEEGIGEGAMATVYRVRDSGTGRILALKLLRERHASDREATLLFEREYQTLVELFHPNIIEAYDYGFSSDRAYYTMELLSSENVAAVVQGDWRRVVGVLRDVCSGLALLHSRGKIHRDVTVRNVRFGADGRAKLIDFGAMTTMGAPTSLVGTPPHIAPEALRMEALDGRTDIFSLGALGYVLLTGRHAFPTRRIQELPGLWASELEDPSLLSPGLPRALDRLILAMLSTDKLGRPVSAAEVIDRLDAVAGVRVTPQVAVAKAYLNAPALVERDELLREFRAGVDRMLGGDGSAVMVKAAPGLGRSRLLSSYVVEARVLGATSLRADGATTRGERFAGARTLIRNAMEALPEASQGAVDAADPSVLVHVVPELAERRPGLTAREFESAAELRARVASAVIRFVRELALARPVVVAVDDVHLADRESAAVLLSLARHARGERLLIVTTVEREVADSDALVSMLGKMSRSTELEGLSESGVHALLESVFDGAPRCSLVAEWIWAVARGNPRTSVQLAEYLVDQGLARHEHGVWTLPDDIKNLGLPQSIEDTFVARIARFGEGAAILSSALALATERSPLKQKDYFRMFACPATPEESAREQAGAALRELLDARWLTFDGERVAFSQRDAVQTLLRSLTAERRAELHLRLSHAYEAGGYGVPLLVAYHLGEAGNDARALDVVFERLKAGGYERDELDRNYPLEVVCHERALATADRLGKPRAVTSPLLVLLLSLAHHHDLRLEKYAARCIADLCHDAGFDYWSEVPETRDSAERSRACMARASEVHAATPEARKGLHPKDALRLLGVALARVGVICIASVDPQRLCADGELFARIALLTPALNALYDVFSLMRDSMTGEAHEDRRSVAIERWKTPIFGVSDSLRSTGLRIMLHQHALYRAQLGSTDGLAIADTLAEHAHYAGLAWDVRMAVHLFQGDLDSIEQARDQRDLAIAHGVENHRLLSTGICFEARARALAGDLIGLKRTLAPIARHAELHRGWRAFERWAQAEYHRLRGEPAEATALLEALLREVSAGSHTVWPWAMSTWIELLTEAGEAERAVAVGREALDACEARNLSRHAAWWLSASLSLAEAATADHVRATRRLERVIAELERDGGGGVPLARLYEQRARIALRVSDPSAFGEFSRRVAAYYRATKNPALAARYEALTAEARELGKAAVSEAESPESAVGTVRERLVACKDAAARALQALEILIGETSARGGLLYLFQGGGLNLAASTGSVLPAPDLLARIEFYLASENEESTPTVSIRDRLPVSAEPALEWRTAAGDPCAIRLLTTRTSEGTRVGGAVLLVLDDARKAPGSLSLQELVTDTLVSLGDISRTSAA